MKNIWKENKNLVVQTIIAIGIIILCLYSLSRISINSLNHQKLEDKFFDGTKYEYLSKITIKFDNDSLSVINSLDTLVETDIPRYTIVNFNDSTYHLYQVSLLKGKFIKTNLPEFTIEEVKLSKRKILERK